MQLEWGRRGVEWLGRAGRLVPVNPLPSLLRAALSAQGLSADALPGVGWATREQLKGHGIATVADLQASALCGARRGMGRWVGGFYSCWRLATSTPSMSSSITQARGVQFPPVSLPLAHPLPPQARSRGFLQGLLGQKQGAMLWDFAHGRDNRCSPPARPPACLSLPGLRSRAAVCAAACLARVPSTACLVAARAAAAWAALRGSLRPGIAAQGALPRQPACNLLHQCCLAPPGRAVEPFKMRKSVGAEVNYGLRFSTQDDAWKVLDDLGEAGTDEASRPALHCSPFRPLALPSLHNSCRRGPALSASQQQPWIRLLAPAPTRLRSRALLLDCSGRGAGAPAPRGGQGAHSHAQAEAQEAGAPAAGPCRCVLLRMGRLPAQGATCAPLACLQPGC